MKMFKLFTAIFLFVLTPLTQALEIRTYTAAALSNAQQSGQSIALQFHAKWCPTCRVQETAIKRLQSEKDLDITVFVVDYDLERELRTKLGVRVQSTVIVYRGIKETARAGGETNPERLKTLFKTAL